MTSQEPSKQQVSGKGITCRDLIGSLMDYLDSVMTADEIATVQEHLALCPSCRNYLESYVQTVRLTRTELRKADAPPPVLPEELAQRIRKSLDGVE